MRDLASLHEASGFNFSITIKKHKFYNKTLILIKTKKLNGSHIFFLEHMPLPLEIILFESIMIIIGDKIFSQIFNVIAYLYTQTRT